MRNMDVKDYLNGELRKHVAAAKAITDKATAEGRALNDDERAQVELNVKAAGDTRSRLTDMTANDELRASIDALGGQDIVVPGSGIAPPPVAKSLGQAFVESKSYKALIESGMVGSSTFNTGPVTLDYFGRKASETVHASDDTPQHFLSGIVDIAKQTNTLLGVLPAAQTDSNIIRYLKETTATNAADDTAEIAAYDQSVLLFDNADVEVEKVATILYVSDEMLADVSGMRSYLDGRLASFVAFQEEVQVIDGSGNTPDLDGFYTQVTATQAKGADTVADAVYKAKTKVRTGSFLEPTHVLIHPTDWEGIRLSKDGVDNYFNGLGPFVGGDVEPPVWGLKPIITSRATQGTAMVGAFGNPMAVQLFRKAGITVEATNSHSDLFAKGQVAIRASSRLALVIYRIAGFCEVTGL
jgi:HK97 family phage major capsid protein